MILAAGFGKRMMPLTERTPKPLLPVAGKPLIVYHIERLAQAGVREIVVNVSHLGQQIVDYCGDGTRFGVDIFYSREESPLETAGGIAKALPLLTAGEGNEIFLSVNGDIWTDFDFSHLLARNLAPNLAHLVMVNNPLHNLNGDFFLSEDGVLLSAGEQKLTYSGIALLSRELFDRYQLFHGPLAPLLRRAMDDRLVTGEHHPGAWHDIGTPERLEEVSRMVSGKRHP